MIDVPIYFHRSSAVLSPGDILTPGGLLTNDPWLEDIFENHKPIGLISRRQAVFLSDTPTGNHGVHGTHCYVVRPLSKVVRLDNVWYGRSQLEFIKQKHGIPSRSSSGSIEEIVSAFACHYWNAIPSESPSWEYLTETASVIEVKSVF